ncbi:hypothetical protein TNCV_1022811 [Trichonephila clavipes]|nr:hypothetical protein TNCV_1022811 [Trichonephila clavipes]
MPGWNCTRAGWLNHGLECFFRGTVCDLWCVYQPPSMLYDTYSCCMITSIRLRCSVICMVMEFSITTTVPLISSVGYWLDSWLDEHSSDSGTNPFYEMGG